MNINIFKKAKKLLSLVITLLFVQSLFIGCFAKELTILHTNDTHGRLKPFQYSSKKPLYGGIARRATLVKDIKKSHKNVLLLDGGDVSQGTIYFSLFNGKPDALFMNEIGYDAMVLGNHEFDKNIKPLETIAQYAKFPLLACNVKFIEKDYLNSIVKPYIIKEIDGLKVGIIGITTGRLDSLVANFNGVEVFHNIKTLKHYVEMLKPKTDLIIVLSHNGLSPDKRLAKYVDGIDIIIGGHTHTLLNEPVIVNNTLVLQAGEFGLNLGKLDLNIENNRIKSYKYEILPVKNSIIPDPEIDSEMKAYDEIVKTYTHDAIGEIKEDLEGRSYIIRKKQTSLGRMVNEAIKYSFPDTEIVLTNSGGLRFHNMKPAGSITHADVLRIHPYDNTMVRCEVKGKQIKSMLERSVANLPKPDSSYLQTLGIDYAIDISKKAQKLYQKSIIQEGQRIKDIYINGKPLEYDKYYKVVTNNFMFDGGNGYIQFKDSINITSTGVLVKDVVIDYIKDNSPIYLNSKDKVKLINYNIKK